MNDSETASTMTVAGEQVAPTLYQNSTEPAKTSAIMSEHDQRQLSITATITLIWLVCIIVCFLKWKTWTAIFGVIGLIVGNLLTTGTQLYYLIMGPATTVALAVVAIRLAKPVSWWAKRFYWGPMGSDRSLLDPSPKLARAFARFPEQTRDFEKPGT
jgi:hypothetical protein